MKYLVLILSLITGLALAQQGGGGPPGGSNFSIQYKNGTKFGGTGPGNAGEVLTSNGDRSPPTFQPGGGGGGASFSIGNVVYGDSAPSDGGTWLQLNGQSVSQSSYPALYAILGQNYLQYKASIGSNPGLTTGSIVAYDGTNWIAVTSGSATTYKSSDGLVWSAGGNLNTSLTSPIIWTNGSGSVFVYNASTTTANLSTDHGATWTGVTLPSSGSWGFAANGSNMVGAKAASTSLIASTDGGATWATVSSALPVTPTNFLGINFDGTQWVIFGVNGTGATQHLKSTVANGQSGWTNTYNATGFSLTTNPPLAIPGSQNLITTNNGYGVVYSTDSGFTQSQTNFTQVQTALHYSSAFWNGLHYIVLNRAGTGQLHVINSAATNFYMYEYLVSGTASTPLAGFNSSNVTTLSMPAVSTVPNFYQLVDKTNHKWIALITQDLTGSGSVANIYVVEPAVDISTNFMLPNSTYGGFTSTNPFPFPKAWIKAL